MLTDFQGHISRGFAGKGYAFLPAGATIPRLPGEAYAGEAREGGEDYAAEGDVAGLRFALRAVIVGAKGWSPNTFGVGATESLGGRVQASWWKALMAVMSWASAALGLRRAGAYHRSAVGAEARLGRLAALAEGLEPQVPRQFTGSFKWW